MPHTPALTCSRSPSRDRRPEGRRPHRAVDRDDRRAKLTQIVGDVAGGDDPFRRRHKPLGIDDGYIEALVCADVDSSPKAGGPAVTRELSAVCLEQLHVMETVATGA